MNDVARFELIGLYVSVDGGPSGRVVDETKMTFLVETASGSLKRVPKPGRRFVFRVGTDAAEAAGQERLVAIEGDNIAFRPEDRTKKVRS